MKKIKLRISLICLSFIITPTEDLPLFTKCPEGFTEIDILGYTLYQKGRSLPECPFEDVLIFDSYKGSIFEKFATSSTNFETEYTSLVVLSNDQHPLIKILEGDIGINKIIFLDDFASAVTITPVLKKQIGNLQIIITAFFNKTTIFGVILPEIVEYPSLVSIYHQISNPSSPKCVHWSYNLFQNLSGSCPQDNTLSTIQCDLYIATHLGLVLLQENKPEDKLSFLAWVNLIDASLSFFGFFGIILTALLFRKWRRNKVNQILLNFVLSLMVHLTLFYVTGQISKPSKGYALCVTLGALLHYSILSQFSWMFVIGILQFKRFVIALGSTPQYLLLKACIFGWGLPSILVSSVLIFDQPSYLNAGINFCYPSGLSLALAVWLPIGITVIFNFCVFVFIIYRICYKTLECGDVGKHEILQQWRLALVLFFLLGVTWGFGFLAHLRFGPIFVHLFKFAENLQGFALFLYLIVFNADTRKLYVEAFRRLICTDVERCIV